MKVLILVTIALISMSACTLVNVGTSTPSSSSIQGTSEVVSGVIANQVQSGESATIASVENKKNDWTAYLFPPAFAVTCDSFVRSASACSNGQAIWDFANCSSALTNAMWRGVLNLSFDTQSSCLQAKTNGLPSLGAGASFVMSSLVGVIRKVSGGSFVTVDSEASGYSASKSGGSTITCGASACVSSRTISISGLHRENYASDGTLIMDHTVSTPIPLVVNGILGTRTVVAGGSIFIQNNLSQITAVATIDTNLTFSSACCFPVGGSVKTTLSTGKVETLVFTSPCGTATLDGSSIALTHCL